MLWPARLLGRASLWNRCSFMASKRMELRFCCFFPLFFCCFLEKQSKTLVYQKKMDAFLRLFLLSFSFNKKKTRLENKTHFSLFAWLVGNQRTSAKKQTQKEEGGERILGKERRQALVCQKKTSYLSSSKLNPIPAVGSGFSGPNFAAISRE